MNSIYESQRLTNSDVGIKNGMLLKLKIIPTPWVVDNNEDSRMELKRKKVKLDQPDAMPNEILKEKESPVCEKPWNLRLKKRDCSSPEMNDGGMKLKKQRRDSDKEKLVVELPLKEIEEDFMKMTCHRATTEAQKRSLKLQKRLDTLFPGLWLNEAEVTPDLCKVPESHVHNSKKMCKKKKC